MITMTRNSLCLIEGDSIADPALGYQVINGVMRTVDSHYMAPSSGSYRRPAWRNLAVSGAVWSDIAGRIATELAANPYTHLFIYCGVNDANNAVALGTSRTSVSTVIAAAQAASVQVCAIGACVIGEKYPTGQNNATKDAALEALDNASTGVQPLFVAAGMTYISTRSATTGLYALETTYNTPAPGITVGPGTRPDASGIHLNPFFASKLTQMVMAQISMS